MRKDKEINLSESQPLHVGPLLQELLRAQRIDERIVNYPDLPRFAEALERRCEELGRPVVWPVGEAAERLAGAAVVMSQGGVRVRGWTDDLRGEDVLLVTVAAVSPLCLTQAADHARTLGAAQVHACGIAVKGADHMLEGYEELAAYAPRAMLAPT